MTKYARLSLFLMISSVGCGSGIGALQRAPSATDSVSDAGPVVPVDSTPGVDAGFSGGGSADGGFDAGSAVADAGSPAADAGTPPPARSCLSTSILQKLGRSKLLVGADMSDAVAESAPFDVRYLYLAGGLADGDGTCSSCAAGCTAAGKSCSNSAGCGWWACWQDPSLPPGQYVRDLVTKTKAHHQFPMITYYELLQASGVAEGSAEVTVAINDRAVMTRLFNDWRLVLKQVGADPAFLHVEPDFWGYAQQVNNNPHALSAAVASVNSLDCAGQENSVAGLGRCLIAMVRKYAPNSKVGLHGSSWGTKIEVMQNTDPSLDVAVPARSLADFLLACGAADGDFVGIDPADRDAGYEQSRGNKTLWDPTNRTLPNFTQAFTWARALTERLRLPALWWQLPLGNMSLPNVNTQWQDNRVDYFFAHTADVVNTNAFGMVFGAGEIHQTTPSTDNGNFVGKVKALGAAGGQAACF